jgi:hypothetical protein
MPVGRRITSLAALAAMAALMGVTACSSDSVLDPGSSVANSEIDQTVVSDAGESIASDVSQFQENESFEENMSSGSSTFQAGRAGTVLGTSPRTVTWADRTPMDGSDASRTRPAGSRSHGRCASGAVAVSRSDGARH